MRRLTLVVRGLRFYRRTHLGVLAGCAVSAAVLVGALFVGDSVRGSLGGIARARLGGIEIVLDAGNRYFQDDLAARVKLDAAAALRVQGMALAGTKQVNRVEVIGVNTRFFGFAERPGATPPRGKVLLGQKLAAALGAKVGEDISLRIVKPTLLSRDAPLAAREERGTERRPFTVAAILSDDQLGRFSLKSDQAAPYNAFVDLKELQEILELERRANLMVARSVDVAAAQAALRDAWELKDLGLSVRAFKTRELLQLQSDRIYLDPQVSAKALALRPDAAGVLSYLVNSITSANGASTPYSFMTSVTPGKLGPVPPGMKDDEIVVNRWLADRISAREGDVVKVAYLEFTPASEFVERTQSFRVHSVVSMEELALERRLVPEFPGLTDVESCKNWKIGLPMDEQKLKDEANEAYWNKYKQTPKAFVTLKAGREMWANRYGDLMAVRYPGEVEEELRRRIDPAQSGLVFRPVRDQALQAATESMDLGQLFLGMSIFLVAASLILTGMFFVFTVEQRAREMGVLMSVGYSTPVVRRLFVAEGAVLAVLGSLAGIPLGWGFARFLLWGLGTEWSGAVADAPIVFHATVGSAIAGAAAAAVISLIAMAVALRRQAKRPVRELVAEDFSLAPAGPSASKVPLAILVAALLGAGGIALAGSRMDAPAGAFFAAGALMLVGGVAGVRMALGRLSSRASARLTVGELGIRNAGRRPGRSLATAGMLACGCFIVFSVGAMKEDLALQAGDRRSGTGGFELVAESSLAIVHDLNQERDRKMLRLTDRDLLKDVSFVPLRLREGDDASCLNLNYSLTPPMLGVDPGKLAALGAFGDPAVWKLLEEEPREGAVPALVGDSATAMWKLKKKVGREGDVLVYTDERGEKFDVRLVGALPSRLTVFQGRLLVSHRHFTRLYPSQGGWRMFLIDAPAGSEDRLQAYLTQRLENAGLDVARSVDRLKEYYVVESAYLRMFLVLGGMGLLLGSAGMGVLVLRNVMERRSELALLRAVGYSTAQASRVVMAEHRFLLGAGLAVGTLASALAIAPSVAQPAVRAPYGLLAAFLLGTAVFSLAWIWIAARIALRAPLTPALRNE